MSGPGQGLTESKLGSTWEPCAATYKEREAETSAVQHRNKLLKKKKKKKKRVMLHACVREKGCMHGLHVYVHVSHGKKGGMLHARNKEGSREEFGRIIGWIWFPNLASCTDQNSKELMCVTCNCPRRRPL